MTTPKLFTPITIGATNLKHRVVLAPLTRNRATPSATIDKTWVPNDLMCEYYGERATDGGLLISEATPISLVASGSLGVPGMFTEEQYAGWKKVTSAVHAKDGKMFCQLSSSNVPITDNPHVKNGLPAVPFEAPHALTVEEIAETQGDFVRAAKKSIESGFDGIEIHAANGYLFDQFHHSNINNRTDQYGGSIENRCRFTLETVDQLVAGIGADRVGVRLAPFGFFNQTLGEQRLEQWTYLCEELAKKGLAYVHLIEPRFDELKSENEKRALLGEVQIDAAQTTLEPFRNALGATPVIAAGGYTGQNCFEGVEKGEHDLVAFGRLYCSNADLVEKVRQGKKLFHYNRARFYGISCPTAAASVPNNLSDHATLKEAALRHDDIPPESSTDLACLLVS
ncbi:hypothetical protein MNV49_000537 [Pseudohyphozyma bogoriensis]|nr:hypothetical protein MNV49_000537 [Pseudohyphozyma bogoriensis]